MSEDRYLTKKLCLLPTPGLGGGGDNGNHLFSLGTAADTG